MIMLVDSGGTRTQTTQQHLARTAETTRTTPVHNLDPSTDLPKHVSGVVLSGGPETEEIRERLVALIDHLPPQIPILGIRQGCRALIRSMNGDPDGSRVSDPGKPKTVFHRRKHLFDELPLPFRAPLHSIRYPDRSSFPPDLLVEADTATGQVVGVRHVELPMFGVLFHPSAQLTEDGETIYQNFVALTERSETHRALHASK